MIENYKFKYIEIPSERVFYFFGDNLLESIELVELFDKYNENSIELIEFGFNTISQFIRKYKINGEIYTFVLTSFFHNGQLPDCVRQTLRKNDKPDVIIYSKDKDKVIFGVESTTSTLAGNATWQRTARTTSFIKSGIPFAFMSCFTKQDKSAGENSTPRKASDLFVALYFALSLKYSVPALIGFYEHADLKQNLTLGKKDWRVDILHYLKALICEENDKKDLYLEKCFDNMKSYYYGNDVERLADADSIFSSECFKYVKDSNFSSNIVRDMKNKNNPPLFTRDLDKWRCRKYKVLDDNCNFIYDYILNDVLDNELTEIDFYQLTDKCKAGITFDTSKLISYLNSHSSHRGYFQDYIKNINYPTVILPTKFRKRDSKAGRMINTEDPYNGEIPAFYELYNQSFGPINFILLVFDHSNITNYDIRSLQNTKTYRTINNYVDLVIDKDYNKMSNQSEGAVEDSRRRYENEFITENDVTSLFKILLDLEDIELSFINPPSGSWSDLKLLPTNKYYYYGKNDERADIAFYTKKDNTYYVGESKDNYPSLRSTLHREEEKVDKIINVISDNLDFEVSFKRFATFGGTIEEAKKVLEDSTFDFVIVVQDENDIVSTFMVERK